MAASSAAAPTSSWEIVEGATAKRAAEAGAAEAAGAELEEDEEMGEEDDEEALEGVPPEVLEIGQSPSQIDMALYAAALEGVGGSGKKPTGRSAKGNKGKAGPSSAGAGGKQPPTPVPMGTTPSIVKTRRSSPRSNNKDA